jgi:hypothetical protein
MGALHWVFMRRHGSAIANHLRGGVMSDEFFSEDDFIFYGPYEATPKDVAAKANVLLRERGEMEAGKV